MESNIKINFKIKKFYNFKPRELDELKKIIYDKVANFDYDLNDIDISEIKSLNNIFNFLKFEKILFLEPASWYSFQKFFEQTYIGVEEWDVSNVIDFSNVFVNLKNFNTDLSCWDTHNGVNFNWMFSGCENFNQNLNFLNLENAQNLFGIFQYCQSLNQECGFFKFNKKLNELRLTFYECKSLNVSFSDWDVSNIVVLDSVFYGTSNLVQSFITWDLKNLRKSIDTFTNSKMLEHIDLIPEKIKKFEFFELPF